MCVLIRHRARRLAGGRPRKGRFSEFPACQPGGSGGLASGGMSASYFRLSFSLSPPSPPLRLPEPRVRALHCPLGHSAVRTGLDALTGKPNMGNKDVELAAGKLRVILVLSHLRVSDSTAESSRVHATASTHDGHGNSGVRCIRDWRLF